MPLTTNGLEMPPDFPSAAYEAVVDIVMANRAGHWSLVDFVGAWHAVSYRFLATADYGSEFVASLAAHGPGPAADERHEQEKMLFGLFGSGHSSFESAFYGLFALGAMVPGSPMSLVSEEDRRAVTPKATQLAFAKAFPAHPTTHTLAAVLADHDFREFSDARHVLTHRSAPGRHHFMDGAQAPHAKWGYKNMPLDQTLAANSRKTVARILTDLIQGAEQFALSHIE